MLSLIPKISERNAAKASTATIPAIIPIYSGWSPYPKPALIDGNKAKTATLNSAELPSKQYSTEAYTRIGSCSSFLLMKRKNPVSMP